jgi:hypothetical protein
VFLLVKKGKCCYLEEDLIVALSACGITNLSEFINFCIEETVLLDQPDYSPKKQAKIVAEQARKKILSQRKLIEEQQTFQQQAEGMHDKFKSEACKVFRNVRSFKSKLPEVDIHGDYENIWKKCAIQLSKSCGFTVTEVECMNFVRQAGEA